MGDVFFGVQVAVRSPAGDPWRERLYAVVRDGRRDQTLLEKRKFYEDFTGLLGGAEARFAFGAWDYIAGDGARAEFDEWVAGVEDDASAGEAPGAGDHVLVTCAFLLAEGSNSALAAGERCDIPEERWFERSTFRDLVDVANALSFSSVRSDAVYLVPGSSITGLTEEALRGEGYDYLKPLG
jgi:hypothetical protein